MALTELLSQLSSLPAPIALFGCFLVVLTLLAGFSLRLGAGPEEPEFYEEVGEDGSVRVAFQFPPHESPEDRRKRWARALRRRFWTGLAPCPNATAEKVTEETNQEVEAFLAALSETVQASRKPAPPKSPCRWQPVDPEAGIPPAHQGLSPEQGGMSSSSIRITPQEAERMRRRIFSVVMSAGPPKSLPPITEEDLLAVHQQAGDLEAGSPGACRVLIGRTSLPPSVSVAWQVVGRSRRKEGEAPVPWAELDSEPVMTVGHVSATRAVLWAVLRRLEAL